jgi:hypothetical protein
LVFDCMKSGLADNGFFLSFLRDHLRTRLTLKLCADRFS